MRRLYSNCLPVAMVSVISVASFAQQATTVSGNIRTSKSNEAISAVSVTVKGGTTGTFTDDKGNFKFTTIQKLPFTLVISSVGYATKEVVIKGNHESVNIGLDVSFTLGDEVVVAASRVPEKILESPVSIERISTAAIRNAVAPSYYDLITNLKGVDVVTASLTFKSVGTRGFNSSGNTRLNQIVDGMDNQAPGLNFSVGNVVGLTELDVDNIELLPGASSALYGAGGMNGTLLINSKNPFKYQGLSFQVKQGVNHIDNYQRDRAPFYDWSLRWANKVTDKFAYKIGAQFLQAQDWLANQTENYSRSTGTAYGQVIPGSRESDPNYDGVNVYGDETSQPMSPIANSVRLAVGARGVGAIDGIINANPAIKLSQLMAIIGGTPALAPLAPYAPILYGSNANKNYFGSQYVSRTGYLEKDVVDPSTVNFKLTGGLYYKLSDKIEASLTANFGTGNSVYTGSDRYSLKDFKISQFKLELKHKNWYARAYTTHENSGASFNATITTRLFNEAWKASSAWYPQYMSAYVTARDAGLPDQNAHLAARGFADQGRPAGFIGVNPIFQQIANTPISKGGGLFLDKSRLNVIEGQYNFSDALGLSKNGTDFLAGASYKQYVLNSQGTLFADTAGNIKINEVGVYGQLSQKLLNDVLKLTVSGRYDKNTNFKGRFTPRVSAVVKLTQDHNLRFSYQTAYRFPTTQDQWINLLVSGGYRLMGGLPGLRDYYNFSSNKVYTPASVAAFGASAQAGSPNPALLQEQQFDEFKPESSQSFEVGYKGLIEKKLLVDIYAYWGKYKDFLSHVTVLQSNTGSPIGLLGTSTRSIYSIAVNTPTEVKTSGWGASAEYLFPKNYSISGNIYSDQLGDLPAGFVSFFNTPKYRVNLAFSNSGFLKGSRYGFGLVYRWVDKFWYEGTFAVGNVPSYGNLDAMVSYKFPSIKSLVKVGGTNVLNKYYRTGFGNPQIGGLYYISFGWNVF